MPRTCVSAAAPGLPDEPRLSRRSLLAALPAAGALAALPAAVTASENDPVVSLYRDWLAARQEWRDLADLPGNGDWDDPRSIAAQDREIDLERRMLMERPTSLEGVGALAAVAWNYVDPGFLDPDDFREAMQNHGECRFLLAIWAACSGKEGYPET